MENNTIMFTNKSVSSNRILYTPSTFARTSLLHLQEIGSLQALAPHTSERSNLVSYLCFIVINGSGRLSYDGKLYDLKTGDGVFIDCRKPYAHSTNSNDLWNLYWCHFYAPFLPSIYKKYVERGGKPQFHPKTIDNFQRVLSDLHEIAASSDYIRDMRINEKLGRLLTFLMEESWFSDDFQSSHKRLELHSVKEYVDSHYKEKILLDDLEREFFINKYYLTKVFKEHYGITINTYILQRRITEAKQLLRFSDMSIEDVGIESGMNSSNYFARMFKKIEGLTPGEYRRLWQNQKPR